MTGKVDPNAAALDARAIDARAPSDPVAGRQDRTAAPVDAPGEHPVAAADSPARRRRDPAAGFGFTVVPHTHWDREWYLPFEVFRIRLARTVEEVCDVLEADPRFTSFTLDGQAVIVEDVVELRPDLEPRLRSLLASRRLLTGPGYVLPDEFLSGPEALVRNFLLGRAVCRRFGAEPMAVGYLPDTFGHVAQLPQILAGFGLDAFVFWRGLGDEANRVGTAFTWRAPDGTSVTAIRQLGSYGNANHLGRWAAGGVDLADEPDRHPATASDRLDRFVITYADEIGRTGAAELLLCNGSDHERIQANLPDLLGYAAGRHPETELRIGSYEDHWRHLRPELGALPVVEGELVGGRDAPVLRGINSARMPLKQAAERSERALLTAEALASLAHLAGRTAWRYPQAELARAWREHLRNLPHDSISGCSVDETHHDMAARFDAAGRIAGRVQREALAALAGLEEPWTYAPERKARVSLVNPLGQRRRDLAVVDLPDELVVAGGVAAFAVDGSELPSQVLPDDPSRVGVEVALDAFGAVGVELRRGTPSQLYQRAGAPAEDTIGNALLTVTGRPDGSVELYDRRTGRVHKGLHRLEDVADRGDEYSFCPLEGDVPVGAVGERGEVRVIAAGPLIAELEITSLIVLPARLSLDRRRREGQVEVPVRTRVRVTAGSDRVEFRTTIDNRAEDHRLRLRFAAPGADHTTTVRAEGHFDVVRRPVRPRWSGAAWTEPPQPTSHTAGFVAAGDLAVFGRGLPEYEAVPVRGGLDIAVTLLRCVGWLSRDDLSSRPGHAGPGIVTPGAQCRGAHAFEYAIAIRPSGASTDTDLVRESAAYRTPVVVGPAGAATGVLRVDGAVVTALKGAEDGDGVVLRLVAPDGGRPMVEGGSEPALEIERVSLAETPVEGQPLVEMRPAEIRTLRLRPS